MKDIIEKEVKVNTKEIEVLKKNFPSCFDKEGNFNIEKFQNMISLDTNMVKESYKLDWLGKSYSRLLANTPVTTLLTEDIDHNSKPENKNSNNLYIEGDNLEVLKLLTNAYSEKIKMIYIDPPYNTGKDFIYQDDRKFTPEELSKMANIDEEEAKRVLDFTNSKSNSHSAWLTFMYPRLYIARELLKEDGVIFISIDDNEQAQLKLLCDEIFGEGNLVKDMVVNTSEGGGNAKYVINGHEYLLVYSKNINAFTNLKRPKDIRGSKIEIEGKLYWIQEDAIRKEFGKYGNLHYEEILEFKDQTYKDMIDCGIKNNEFILVPKSTGLNIIGKLRLVSDDFSKFHSIIKPNYISKNLNAYGVEEVEKLFSSLKGNCLFPFPKPLDLLKKIILSTSFNGENELILDFFSGSCTTSHAVMQLNAEDNGNRKFIMVQIPEAIDSKKSKCAYEFCIDNKLKPIIPSIAKERIKRASKKIVEENQDKDYIKNLDFGFKVFKTKELDNSNYLNELESFDPTKEKLFPDDILSMEELYSLALTWKTHDGIPLTVPFNTISLSSYEALIVENRIYLMYSEFTTEALQELLRYNDEEPQFLVNSIIIYGLNFTSKNIKEIQEAIMMNNKKSATIDLEVRY